MDGILLVENFVADSSKLFEELKKSVDWDERMYARFTASFGVAYNYSQISYPFLEMPPQINELCEKIEEKLGFKPNNCLINYYPDGKSKMGFHSDQIDILESETGIAIISLGEERILRFRKISDKENMKDYTLRSGSLIYMTQEIQQNWQHSVPKSDTENGRMSLTFRKIKLSI